MCLLLKSEGGYSTNKLTVSHIFWLDTGDAAILHGQRLLAL